VLSKGKQSGEGRFDTILADRSPAFVGDRHGESWGRWNGLLFQDEIRSVRRAKTRLKDRFVYLGSASPTEDPGRRDFECCHSRCIW
jgi:hypothetical protein